MRVTRLILAVFLLAACETSDGKPSVADEPPSDLVGVWALESYTLTDRAGGVLAPYGAKPRGRLAYGEKGQMSVQLMRSDYDLTPFSGLDVPTAIGEIGVSAFFAYWGTYTVDEGAGTVTHQLEGCLQPAWVGTRQVRAFRLEGPDLLVLLPQGVEVGNRRDVHELRWRRLE